MNMADQQNLFRQIPAVDQLMLRPAVASWIECTSREFVVLEIQKILENMRTLIRSGTGSAPDVSPEHVESVLVAALQTRLRPNLRTVINATGVILHTNLGRAPLSTAAQESLSAFSANYTNLEYEILTGQRWHRDKLVESLLQEVLGCDAATVVNNNAAAVFLILNTLAAGKEERVTCPVHKPCISTYLRNSDEPLNPNRLTFTPSLSCWRRARRSIPGVGCGTQSPGRLCRV